MKKFRKLISLLSAFMMLFSVFVSASFTSTSAANVTPLGCLKQNDAVWKDYYYGEGNLYDTGCGIFSLVNAVGYLTGKRMSVTDVASWAHSINAFNVTGAEGTYRTVLYPNVEKEYGETYGFTVDCSTGTGYWEGSDSTTLKSHLSGGGVAVGHVPNHFIAIVGYDSIENKFHVYDSYATNARGTNTNGGDVWVTQSQLASGQLCLDWFCLLSLKDNFDSSDYSTGVYETTTDLNIRDTASASGTLVDTIPMGTPVFVTFVTENGWGYTSYNGSVGYINLKYAQYTGELPASAECTVGIYTNKTDLNLRTSSSYKSNSVTVIPANTTLYVTKVSSGWGYTEYQDYTGWINLAYAEYVAPFPTFTETDSRADDSSEPASETETITSTQTTELPEETTAPTPASPTTMPTFSTSSQEPTHSTEQITSTGLTTEPSEQTSAPTPASPTTMPTFSTSFKEPTHSTEQISSTELTTEPSEQTSVSTTASSTPPTSKPTQATTKPAANLGAGTDGRAAESAILTAKDDSDPKGSAFNLLRVKNTKITKNSIKITYKKPSATKNFVIYGAKCGKSDKKLTITTKKTFTYKNLKKGKYYKLLVVALDKNGKVVSTSKAIHVATKGGRVGNTKKVTITNTKKSINLKKAMSFKLKVKLTAESKKLTIKKHRALKFETSNKKVATVTNKGKIKARKKGTATVYAYAQNGVMTKIKVVVK